MVEKSGTRLFHGLSLKMLVGWLLDKCRCKNEKKTGSIVEKVQCADNSRTTRLTRSEGEPDLYILCRSRRGSEEEEGRAANRSTREQLTLFSLQACTARLEQRKAVRRAPVRACEHA